MNSSVQEHLFACPLTVIGIIQVLTAHYMYIFILVVLIKPNCLHHYN